MLKSWGPLTSTPPTMRDEPMCPWYLTHTNISNPSGHGSSFHQASQVCFTNETQRRVTLVAISAHLNSICLSCRVTVTTRGGRPVLRECSSMFDDIIWVVTSASAATPAPQQLANHRAIRRQQKANHSEMVVKEMRIIRNSAVPLDFTQSLNL